MRIPNEGVNLDGLDVVESLDGILDVVLVGTDIADEHKGVLILDLAHGRLGVQGELDDGVLVQGGGLGAGATSILGGTGQLEGLGEVEAHGGANLLGGLGVGATEGSLLGTLGFLGDSSGV